MILIERDGKCVGHMGGGGRCRDGGACSTGLPGSRHRGKHGRVFADHHAGGCPRGADGLVFPTANTVTRHSSGNYLEVGDVRF